jgi:hypothetical protein
MATSTLKYLASTHFCPEYTIQLNNKFGDAEAQRMRVGDWLRRLFGASFPSAPLLPAGFTDDMSVPLPPGRTPEHVVDFVLAANERGQEHAALVAAVAGEFELSADDAALAIDRVGGGFVRAMTGNRHNCPDRVKDPIAWASFQRAITKR